MRISLGIVTLLGGCSFMGVKGSGTVKTEPRPVPAFSQILLASSVDAEISTGPTAQLELTGDDNLLPLITTAVVGDKLEIRARQNLRPSQHLTAKIVVPKLTGVDLAGSGDARLDHLDADALTVSIAGSGDVRGAGHARALDISVAGTGEVRLADFPADAAKINVSGTGDIEVTVNQTLDVNISGTGDVTYHGNPRVTKNVSGTGDLTHK